MLHEGATGPLILDRDTGAYFHASGSALEVLRLCEKPRNLEALTGELCARFPEERGRVENDVREFVQKALDLRILARVAEDHQERKDYDSCLHILHCELTGHCNLRCRHCYGRFGPVRGRLDGLNLRAWKRVLDEAIGLQVEVVQLTGGEPLLFDGLLGLIDHARNGGVPYIEVFSNATRITPQIAQAFAERDVGVRVSVYGHRAELHEAITGIDGSFDELRRGIGLLVQKQVRCDAACVVFAHNRNHLHEIGDFVRGTMGIPIRFDGFRPRDEEDLPLTGAAQEPQSLAEYEKNATVRRGAFDPRLHVCFSGRACVASHGVVFPSVFARELPAGDVRESSLGDIYQGKLAEYRRAFAADNIRGCRSCIQRYHCTSCRPSAAAVSGDWLAPDPSCALAKDLARQGMAAAVPALGHKP